MSEYKPYSTEQLQNLATNWERRHEKEDWVEGKTPEPRFLEFVEKHRNELGPEILDIGAGQGRHALPLSRMGYKVTALELTENGLEIIKRKLSEEGLPANLVQGDFHNLPFEKESFDTIVSLKSLHNNNWTGAEQSFKEASRVLKPGGLFFCMLRSTTNNTAREGAKDVDDRGKTWTRTASDTGVELMIHDFTLEELTELAEKNNLEIIDTPFDERQKEDGTKEPGQWNVTFRKK